MNKTTNKVKTKVTEKQEVNKKILPTLREMDLYKTETWPISRVCVVNSTIQKVKLESEKQFTYRTNRDAKTIEVTRIK